MNEKHKLLKLINEKAKRKNNSNLSSINPSDDFPLLGTLTKKDSGKKTSAMSVNRGALTLDPVAMLGLTPQEIMNTTELHMARRGIRTLHGNMLLFTNLETLWLNGNDIEKLVGLLPSERVKGRLTSIDVEKKKKRDEVRRMREYITSVAAEIPEHVKNSATVKLIGEPDLTINIGNISGDNQLKGNHSDAGNNHVHTSYKDITSTGNVDITPETSRSCDYNRTAALAVPLLGCVRLKHLCLSSNCLSTVDGDLQSLHYLEVLQLSDNLLTDLENTSKKLRNLRFLKNLDLFGNPLCEEQHYRLYIIAHHPSLIVFDRITITEKERQESTILFPKHAAGYSALLESRSSSSERWNPVGGNNNNNTSLNILNNSNRDVSIRRKNRTDGDTSSNHSSSVGYRRSPTAQSNNINNNNTIYYPTSLINAQDISPKERRLLTGSSHSSQNSNNKNSTTINKHKVAFGTSYNTDNILKPTRPVSRLAAMNKAKCLIVTAEREWRRRYEKNMKRAEIKDLTEQRRVFHQLWEDYGSGNMEVVGDTDISTAITDNTIQASPIPVPTESILLKRNMSIKTIPIGSKGGSVDLNTDTNGNKAGDSKRDRQAHHRDNKKSSLKARDKDVTVSHLAGNKSDDTTVNLRISRLFTIKSTEAIDPRISHLIELTRRAEEAANSENSTLETILRGEVKRNINCLIPERSYDVFNETLKQEKESSYANDSERYHQELIQNVILSSEQFTQLRNRFLPKSTFYIDMLPKLLKTLGSDICSIGGVLQDILIKSYPSEQEGNRGVTLARLQLQGLTVPINNNNNNNNNNKAIRISDDAVVGDVSVRSNVLEGKINSTNTSKSSYNKKRSITTGVLSIDCEVNKNLQKVTNGYHNNNNINNNNNNNISTDHIAAQDINKMRPIPLETALRAVVSYYPAMAIRLRTLEQEAKHHFDNHRYDMLGPLQRRINDLTTHCKALKRQAEGNNNINNNNINSDGNYFSSSNTGNSVKVCGSGTNKGKRDVLETQLVFLRDFPRISS